MCKPTGSRIVASVFEDEREPEPEKQEKKQGKEGNEKRPHLKAGFYNTGTESGTVWITLGEDENKCLRSGKDTK